MYGAIPVRLGVCRTVFVIVGIMLKLEKLFELMLGARLEVRIGW